MKRIQLLVFAAFAVFAFSALTVASSALALESVWLVGGVKPTAETSVDDESIGELLLEDMKATGGASDVDCTKIDSEGSVFEENSAKFDLVTSVTFLEPLVNCKILSGACSSLDNVQAINLPWLTELLLVLEEGASEETYLDDILGTGAGAPGYLIECVTLLGLVDDACTTEAASVDIDNNAAAGDVVALFKENALESEFANCTIGGAKAGLVVGEDLNLTLSGASLAVSEG